MEKAEKTTFPMMPVSHWWTLRSKFKQSIPGVVTENYLASVLNMSPVSARTNILPSLRSIGLIDENNKPTEIAKKWRDDEQYTNVCKQIRKDIYPGELIDIIPGPKVDRTSCSRWFANHTGSGNVAVTKMVAFFIVLSEANPEQSVKSSEPKKSLNSVASIKKPPLAVKQVKDSIDLPLIEKENKHPTEPLKKESGDHPAIHLNLQIHISADSSSDQIDKIFESMSKHIYKGYSNHA